MSSSGRGLLFIVSAPSGAGKTTLVERLVEQTPRLSMSRSYTSRPVREGERDGVDYNFVTRDRFDAMTAAGEFLECADVFGNLYGTRAADTEQILALVDNHMRFAHVQQMKESTFKRFVRMPRFNEHLELHRMDCLSSHGDLTSYNFTREKMNAMPATAMRPAPLITGDDLISSGYAPGPQFRKILSAVEDGQLEGRLRSRDEALTFVQSEFPNGG